MLQYFTCKNCQRQFAPRKHKPTTTYCSVQCLREYEHKTFESRFWARVDQSGGPDACWPWMAHVNHRGYGIVKFWLFKKQKGAHRVAYFLTHGAIPEGHEICHTCDNPPCCNPKHLFAGTHSENIRDMYAKGRDNLTILTGERNPSAKLTRNEVMAIRAAFENHQSIKSIANQYGMAYNTIWCIIARRTWREV